jgi:hypothetical protein
MKFEIPKVTRFLPLQEYAPDEPTLVGIGIHVWVDPPRSILMEFDRLNRAYSQVLTVLASKLGNSPVKKISPVDRLITWLHIVIKRPQDDRFKSETESYRRSIYAWYAKLWSQSPDAETHWSMDELEKINDENPRLYEWLCFSSHALIEQHRDDVKKGYRGPSVKTPEPKSPAPAPSAPVAPGE